MALQRLGLRDCFLLLAGMTLAYTTTWLYGYGLFMPQMNLVLPGAEQGGLSLLESYGFIDDTDDNWLLRKTFSQEQLRLQYAHRGDCEDCNGHAFWQIHYEPSFSCAFERRLGPVGDGGKWVCDPHRIARAAHHKEPCLVYSIGSNGDFGFESGVHDGVSEFCEIHVFDANPWTEYTQIAPPDWLQYHVHTISNGSFPEIYRTLGHSNRTIDIFKIDCESCEFGTYMEWFAEGVFIRQILVELHGPAFSGAPAVHALFDFLQRMGYVIYHKEPNTLSNNFAEGGNYVEFALLRLAPEVNEPAMPP